MTVVALLLTACTGPLPPSTMPPADGRAERVQHDFYHYDVGMQASAQAQGGLSLRITRADGPDMDYSDGFTAKAVANDFCGHYNRKLNPGAFGMFSAPASWIFEGGCL